MTRTILRGSEAEKRYLKNRATKSAAGVGQFHYSGSSLVVGHKSNLSEFLRIAQSNIPPKKQKSKTE